MSRLAVMLLIAALPAAGLALLVGEAWRGFFRAMSQAAIS